METDHEASKTETNPVLPDQSLKVTVEKCFKREEEWDIYLGAYHSHEGQRFINLSGKRDESGQIETEHLRQGGRVRGRSGVHFRPWRNSHAWERRRAAPAKMGAAPAPTDSGAWRPDSNAAPFRKEESLLYC